MRIYQGFIPLSIWIMLATTSGAQTSNINYYDSIATYDIGVVLTADSILAEDREGSSEKVKRMATVGMVGDNFQRLHIHFLSVVKHKDDPYKYTVRGWIKLNAVRHFTGTLFIKEAKLDSISDIPGYTQGYIVSELNLTEDEQSLTIKGILVSNFIIDNNRQLRYNAIDLSSGDFHNNQFTGAWKDDKVNLACRWGDYRIPSSGDLDIGAGEFSPSEKYLSAGWQQYHDAYIKNDEEALRNEESNWWDCDSVIGASVNTEITLLKNQAKLYYQFNCDSIWLTLEQKTGKKAIIFSMGSELHGYLYRLGFQLIKEEQHILQFRTGCAANGPCNYVWIDKNTGRVLRSR